MMDMVLERLRTLQVELAALDPSRELDVADKVASIASALRDTLAAVDSAPAEPAMPAGPRRDLRRAS